MTLILRSSNWATCLTWILTSFFRPNLKQPHPIKKQRVATSPHPASPGSIAPASDVGELHDLEELPSPSQKRSYVVLYILPFSLLTFSRHKLSSKALYMANLKVSQEPASSASISPEKRRVSVVKYVPIYVSQVLASCSFRFSIF